LIHFHANTIRDCVKIFNRGGALRWKRDELLPYTPMVGSLHLSLIMALLLDLRGVPSTDGWHPVFFHCLRGMTITVRRDSWWAEKAWETTRRCNVWSLKQASQVDNLYRIKLS